MSRQPNDLLRRERPVRSLRFVRAASVLWVACVVASCGGTTISETTTIHPPGSETTRATPAKTGTTPPPVPSKISGFLAQSASFITDNDGYVLGDVACRTGVCLALQRTADRGVTWTSVVPPPRALGQSELAEGPELHFADGRDGWAYGSSLWVTHDGAKHWHALHLGGTVLAMGSGAGEVYALVEPCQPVSPCRAAMSLYRSPTRRDAWAEVPGVGHHLDQFGPAPYDLVVEGHAVFVWSAHPEPELLASTNGRRFVSLTVPCRSGSDNGLGPFTLGAMAASDPSDLAVVCLGAPSMQGEAEQIYLSHDGGRTYQRLPDAEVGFAGELSMPDPTTLLLAGGLPSGTWAYRLTVPHDSWSKSIQFSDQGAGGLSDLAFVDPVHGVLVHGPASIALSILRFENPPPGLGEVYLTDNGGSTWYRLHIPV
jgi:hypothetical protein